MTTTGGNMKEFIAWVFVIFCFWICVIVLCAIIESAKISEYERKVWGDDEDM